MVEYSDELFETEGLSRNDAATESAKRRLRPIFLTTMAAAIGVVPMIVMKDPMWAPLASVFAFGIVFSMVINFMVLPVFYAWFIKSSKSIENKEEKSVFIFVYLLIKSQFTHFRYLFFG